MDVGGTVAQLVVGMDHNCALLATGDVRCWGFFPYGRVGEGQTAASTPFVDVGGPVTQLVAGAAYGWPLLTGGTVRCFGWGTHGSLGYPGYANVAGVGMPAALGDVQVGGDVVALST